MYHDYLMAYRLARFYTKTCSVFHKRASYCRVFAEANPCGLNPKAVNAAMETWLTVFEPEYQMSIIRAYRIALAAYKAQGDCEFLIAQLKNQWLYFINAKRREYLKR